MIAPSRQWLRRRDQLGFGRWSGRRRVGRGRQYWRFHLRTIGSERDGATPLDEDDLEGPVPDFVATRGDLNGVEYDNITKALPWARAQAARRGPSGVLDYAFLFELHRRMFGDVWRWAGTQRRRVANLGVEPAQIPETAKQAIDDARYWHENAAYSADEVAADGGDAEGQPHRPQHQHREIGIEISVLDIMRKVLSRSRTNEI